MEIEQEIKPQVKMDYKTIVKSIYNKALKEKTDVRKLIREWIMLFESSRVVGWDRMKFLDYCVEESKRLSYNSQQLLGIDSTPEGISDKCPNSPNSRKVTLADNSKEADI